MAPSDFVSRGEALVAAGQYQEAVKICRLGLLGQPTAVEGRVVLGQALLALRRYDEVLAEMRVALELDNASAAAYQLKGEALLRKGDSVAAIEALGRAKQLAQNDPSVAALLAEAEIAKAGSVPGAFGHVDLGDSMTKHYPSHQGEEGSGQRSGSHTKPTSLAKPPSPGRGRPDDFNAPEPPTTEARPGARRSSQKHAVPWPKEVTPSPAVLSVGDRSGTVEVDPDQDGVEMGDDFGDLADPPVPAGRGERLSPRGPRPGPVALPAPRAKAPSRQPPPVRPPVRDDDDVIELSGVQLIETPPPQDIDAIEREIRGRKRPSVGMPAGPLPDAPAPPRISAAQLEAANRPTAIDDQVPPYSRPPVLPLPSAPRPPVAAALPTVHGQAPPPPAGLPPPGPRPRNNAGMPTLSLNTAQERSAAAVEQLFPDDKVTFGAPMPNWARSTMVAPGAAGGIPPRGSAPPGAQTQRPGPAVDPESAFGNLLIQPTPLPAPPPELAGLREDTGNQRHHRTGVRGPRKLKVALWVALGTLVIGGGVFAGFQIRRIRLDRQIDAAIAAAQADARPDTWLGWIKARNGFINIVEARDTEFARAQVARARAVLAVDYGDDVPGARKAVEALGATGGGGEGAIARAYLAVLAGDPAAAKAAAAAADKASDDPATHALVGRAALLGGRYSDAVVALKIAVDKDPRPAYLVAHAQAELGRHHVDDARASCDRAIAMVADHPAALIVRARVLAAAGALTGPKGVEVTGELDRVLAEGARAPTDQTVGVSPRQAADAALALVLVQVARGDAQAARLALDRATNSRPDDQRFTEDVIDALLHLGQYTQARAEAQRALDRWPASMAARIAFAEAQLVEGDAAAALETLAKGGALTGEAEALTLRGRAHLARGELDAARTDLDAALAAAPDLEVAVVGRTWVDLRAGEAAQALGRIEPLYATRTGEPSVATAYAAALRQTGARDKAREVLRQITAGPEGPELAGAWLELGRLERDVGDYAAARRAYGKAIGGRGIEAKLEAALLYIDDADVSGGHDTLEALVKQAPSDGRVLVETARARTLLGDLAGARELLDRADKVDSAPAGDLARERGRLAIKAAKFTDAIDALESAIRTNNADFESYTMLLDAIGAIEDGAAKQATDLLEPAKKRFGDKPERFLIMGKVALITDKTGDARGYFEQARKELEARRAPPRRIAEALFGLGRCAEIANELGAAVQLFDDGLRRDPTATDVWFALGDIAATQGRTRRALDRYQNAAKYNPEYPDLAYQVGLTAYELGEDTIAKESLERYLDLAPADGEHVADARRMLGQLK